MSVNRIYPSNLENSKSSSRPPSLPPNLEKKVNRLFSGNVTLRTPPPSPIWKISRLYRVFSIEGFPKYDIQWNSHFISLKTWTIDGVSLGMYNALRWDKVSNKACLRKNANFVKHWRFQHFLTTYSKILRHISPALFILNLKMSLILILGAKLAEIFESEYKEEKILHLLFQRKMPFLGFFWNCILLVILDTARQIF